jgi:prolyl 4-hydroxylase
MGRNLKMKVNNQGFLELNKFPKKKLIHQNPDIYYIENFLSHNECNYLIALSEKNVAVSKVVDKATGQGVVHPSRTSESCYHGYSVKWLISRVNRLTGVPKENQEPTQVARYNTGQFYKSHQDALDKEDSETGQRIATVLIYLNNVNSGGGTYLNNLNVRVKPKEGEAVIFLPAKVDGTIDSRLLHTAEDASDTKWVSQIWVRNKKYAKMPLN